MMITIHGFPAKTKYQDVKILIKQECPISDFILDNLVSEKDGTKKVRIGLTDNSEGYRLMKSLDGYRLPGNFVLKVIPVGKPAPNPQEGAFDSRPGFSNQQSNDYSNPPRNDYMGQPRSDYNNQGPHGGLHGPSGPHSHGVGGPHGSMDSMNRPSPWAPAGNNPNSWNSNSSMMAQAPQNSFGYNSPQANMNPGFRPQNQPHQSHSRPEMRSFNQRSGPPDQNFGYTPKNNVTDIPADQRFLAALQPNRRSMEHNQPLNFPSSSYPSSSYSSEGNCSMQFEGHTDQEDEALSSTEAGPGDFSDQFDPANTEGEPLSNKAKKKEKFKKRDIKKLAGAARRRLWWWKKQGKSFAEARELCEMKFNKVPEYKEAREARKARMYERSQRNMSPSTLEKEKKLARLKGPAPGTKQEKPQDPPIRVRIVDGLGYMSEEKIDKIQDKILDLMDAEVEENSPKFVGCLQQSGTLLLKCGNETTLEWLRNYIPDIQLWEGANLSIINLSDMPKPLIAVTFIPDPKLDEESILKMLKTQNSGLDFSDWWITHRKLENEGQSVTFSINQSSLQKLSDRSNWLYLGFRKIKIRVVSKLKSLPSATAGPESSDDYAIAAMPEPSGNRPGGTKFFQNMPRGGKSKGKNSKKNQQNFNPGGPPGRGGFKYNSGKRGRGGKSRGTNMTLSSEQCADRSRFVWRKWQDQPTFNPQ